jgi:acyl carrier protein
MSEPDVLRLLEAMLELRPNSLTGRERLREDLPWDSMSSLAFIAEVDRQFGLRVPGARVVECKTVEDLLRLLESTQADRAA